MISLRRIILFIALNFCQRSFVSSLPPPTFTTVPNIITDGVTITLSQDETVLKEHVQGQSAPGCPKPIHGHPWVYYKYYERPKRCYLTGFRGVCEKNRIFFPQRNSPDGICACECLMEQEKRDLLNNTDPYIICPHETNLPYMVQIFDKKEKKCYTPMEASKNLPCKEGEVIANWTETHLNCLPLCHKSPAPCTDLPVRRYWTGVTSILGRNCADGEKWSDEANICVSTTPVEFI